MYRNEEGKGKERGKESKETSVSTNFSASNSPEYIPCGLLPREIVIVPSCIIYGRVLSELSNCCGIKSTLTLGMKGSRESSTLSGAQSSSHHPSLLSVR